MGVILIHSSSLQQKHGLLLSLSCLIVFLCFLYFKITGCLYIDIDNYGIALVTSSAFDGNNYCYHVHPLLCLLIKGLSSLYSAADWYTVLTQLNIALCSVWLLFLILSNSKMPLFRRIALIVLVILLLSGCSLWNANFSVQTAFFCLTGFLTLFVFSSSWENMLPAVFFLICGMLWRMEIFLLFLPFAALKMFFSFRWNPSTELRKGAVLLFLFLLFFGSKLLVDYSPRYSEATKYNLTRSSAEDYPLRSWNDLAEHPDVSEVDYHAVSAWFLLDTENLGRDVIESVAKAGTYRYSFTEIMRYFPYMLSLYPAHCLFLLFLLIYGFLILLTGKKQSDPLMFVLGFAGFCLIVLYFIRIGRLPLRVLDSLIMAFSLLFLPELFQNTVGFRRNIADFVLAVICSSTVILSVSQSSFSTPQWALCANTDNRDIFAELSSQPEDSLFIWEDYNNTVKLPYMHKGKLMPREFLTHNLSIGSWTYGQLYQTSLLRSIDAENPARALLERPHTYYVSDYPATILEFLRFHYGEDIQSQYMGLILGRQYWAFLPADDIP